MVRAAGVKPAPGDARPAQHVEAPRRRGADIVVRDLAELERRP